MKLKYLTVGAIATLATITVACTRNEAAPQPTEAVPSASVISTPVSTSPATSSALKSGQFVTAEHTTEGAARIVTEDGKRYLVLDSAFMTYISLGELKNVKGEQRYAIPDDADLDTFRSVVIWCRMFNATFGYAPFAAQ
jgi:hypothetical protein